MATQPDSSTRKRRSLLRGRSNLVQRLITITIVLPVFLLVSIAGGALFAIVLILVGGVAAAELLWLQREWVHRGAMLTGLPTVAAIILAPQINTTTVWLAALPAGALATATLLLIRAPRQPFRNLARLAVTLMSASYIGFPLAFLSATRELEGGLTWIALIYLVTWMTDSCAYVGGRLVGRIKLAPAISPNKTLEGAIIGAVGGAVTGLLVLAAGAKMQPALLPLVIVLPFAAIVGDLAESALKRYWGVKDSHIPGFDIMPGHGGMLDRIDSLLWVSTAVYLYITQVAGLN